LRGTGGACLRTICEWRHLAADLLGQWEMTMLAHIQNVFGGQFHYITVINTIARKLMPESRRANATDFCFLIGQYRVKRFNNFEITPAADLATAGSSSMTYLWLSGARIAVPALMVCALVLADPAHAQSEDSSWTRSNLLGDMGGLRTTLGDYGITLALQDTENLLGNVSGGLKQGSTMQGVTIATLQIDTQKAFGLAGGTINMSALQIHGQSLSPYYLDDLQTASGTEAEDATRLWELWYDQSFANGAFDIKLGQQSIDQEFMVSKYSALFVNAMAGWPMLPCADLYAGGPAYPLSSLGIRGLVRPASNLTILAGVFDDNPPGGAFADDPQSADAGGVRFNLNTSALFIAEAQLQVNLFAGPPGTYKLGFWYDTGSFPDQAVDNQGLSLANPESDGIPEMHKGNYSVYGVVDQTLWQPKGSTRSLNVFARLMGAPVDQNLISFSANAGLTLTDPLPGRPNDSAGIDFGLAKVSGRAADLDRADALYSGGFVPVRGTETLIELTYQAQVTPWLQIQPDAQFIVNPGGGVMNPDAPTERLHDEVVVGVRTNINF
jgi:porin